MKLRHITFTGIDDSTDLNEVQRIQEQYPYVEWGLLLSKKRSGFDPRYPSRHILCELENRGLNLSAHICGIFAREIAATNNWNNFFRFIEFRQSIFQRAQLNIADYKFENMGGTNLTPPYWLKEIIIQQKNTNEIDFYKAMRFKRNYVSILFDASDGRGIKTTNFELAQIENIKAGYAGGINAENIKKMLPFLLDFSYHPFWSSSETTLPHAASPSHATGFAAVTLSSFPSGR